MSNFNEICTTCIYEDTCVEQPPNCESYIDKKSVEYGVWAQGESTFCGNNTIEFGVGLENKSHLKIGNLVIHNTHHFNWLERKMWKLLLGFEIENVEE